MSLLVGETQLARDISEIHGPEAAILVRAAYLATGVPEPLVDAAYVLSRDPEVAAQVTVLAASGATLADVLAASTTATGVREYENLRLAARDLTASMEDLSSANAERLTQAAREALTRAERDSFGLLADARRRVAPALERVRSLGPDTRNSALNAQLEFQRGLNAVSSETTDQVSGLYTNVSQTNRAIEARAEATRREAAAEIREREAQVRRAAEETRRNVDRAAQSVYSDSRRLGSEVQRNTNRALQDAQRRSRATTDQVRRGAEQFRRNSERTVQDALRRLRRPGGG